MKFYLGILVMCLSNCTFSAPDKTEWDLALQQALFSKAAVLSEQAKEKRKMQDASGADSFQKKVKNHLKSVLFDDEDIAGFLGTPLNARICGKPLHKEKYDIYLVAYESIPGVWVTANLYVPGFVTFPVPGIVAVSDHAGGGKAADYNQRMGMAFAQLGYVALVIDFPDRGELIGGNDHFVNGTQVALTGLWPNYLFVVNAIRAVDYLQSRTDIVNPQKIGMTGTSGGGATTLTAAAMDDRIAAAVACCCVEPLEACLRSTYTSCPEYLIPQGLLFPLEWSDIASLVAPRPLIMVHARKDGLFTQAGFEQTADAVSQFYRIQNVSEKFRPIQTNEPHTYSAAMREAAYYWFSQWLGNPTGQVLPKWQERILEPDDVKFTPKDTDLILETEAVLSVGAKSTTSLHSIAKGRAEQLARRYTYNLQDFTAGRRQDIIERVQSFYNPPKQFPQLKIHSLDKTSQNDIITDTLVIEPMPGMEFPAMLIRPAKTKIKSVLLYMDQDGSAGLAKRGFDKLPQSEVAVLSVDLMGMGKLYPRPSEWDKYPWCDISRILSYGSWTMGTSIPHLQITQTLAALAYIRQHSELNSASVYVAGIGQAAPIALMVTAMEDTIKGLIGIRSLVSYRAYAEHLLPSYNIMAISYGLLKQFDIPVVLAAIANRVVLWAEPIDADQKPLSDDQMRQEYHLAISILSNGDDIFVIGDGSGVYELVFEPEERLVPQP